MCEQIVLAMGCDSSVGLALPEEVRLQEQGLREARLQSWKQQIRCKAQGTSAARQWNESNSTVYNGLALELG